MSITYEEMLKRAHETIPKKSLEHERFEFPNIESFVQGPKTFVKNFGQLQKAMRRDDPKDLLKFLTRESATSAQIDGDRLILNGKFSTQQIQTWFERFLEEFVLCKECGKPDTHYIVHNSVRQLKCEACGAISPLRRG
jgi:translation initiation factor 2 subunit 2